MRWYLSLSSTKVTFDMAAQISNIKTCSSKHSTTGNTYKLHLVVQIQQNCFKGQTHWERFPVAWIFFIIDCQDAGKSGMDISIISPRSKHHTSLASQFICNSCPSNCTLPPPPGHGPLWESPLPIYFDVKSLPKSCPSLCNEGMNNHSLFNICFYNYFFFCD